MAIDFNDQVAARTVWMEARGEGPEGMEAVAHVIKNRMADGRWGNTASSVCLWHSQFSGWSSNDPNFAQACRLADTDPTLAACLQAWLNGIFEQTDPTGGACFYFASTMAEPPAWAASMTETVQIGRHKFYRDK